VDANPLSKNNLLGNNLSRVDLAGNKIQMATP
jgi:hypothetical protein